MQYCLEIVNNSFWTVHEQLRRETSSIQFLPKVCFDSIPERYKCRLRLSYWCVVDWHSNSKSKSKNIARARTVSIYYWCAEMEMKNVSSNEEVNSKILTKIFWYNDNISDYNISLYSEQRISTSLLKQNPISKTYDRERVTFSRRSVTSDVVWERVRVFSIF